MSRDQQTSKLGTIRVPRPADVYAEELRTKILNGELSEGSRLPSERVLVEESGLARSVIRDALQQLQQQGFLITQTGRTGGSIVTRPTASAFANSVEVHLRGWAPSAAMLVDARRVIEPWCAYYAAEQRTDDDIRILTDLHHQTQAAATGGRGDFVECKIRWHSALATASHNDVLSTFIGAVSRSIFTTMTASELRGAPDDIERSLAAHAAITAAVCDGEAASAYKLMSGHLHTPVIA